MHRYLADQHYYVDEPDTDHHDYDYADKQNTDDHHDDVNDPCTGDHNDAD